MLDGLLLLIFLCIVMAASSFLVGMLPLHLSLSSRQLRLISAFGTGILVGVALIIIIPEGVETLYAASGDAHAHGARSVALSNKRAASTRDALSGVLHDAQRRDEITTLPGNTDLSEGYDRYDGVHYVEEATAAQELDNELRQQQQEGQDDTEADPSEEDGTSTKSRDPHAWVGLSLITGFVLMYLIDTLPRKAPSSRPERFHVSLNNLNFNNRSPSMPAENGNLEPQTPTASSHSHSATARPSSTTTGLVIHACADGIALGASSTTTTRLTFIIFLALIIHKAPAAFGLTAVLLKQGLSKRMARAHLIVFSLAAPVGALVTWAAAHLLGYSSANMSNSMSTEFATGVLLSFSGGTFLYVATHTMQDSHDSDDGEGMQMNGYRGVSMSDVYETTARVGVAKGADGKPVRLGETGLTVLGMLMPLLFQFGHGH